MKPLENTVSPLVDSFSSVQLDIVKNTETLAKTFLDMTNGARGEIIGVVLDPLELDLLVWMVWMKKYCL